MKAFNLLLLGLPLTTSCAAPIQSELDAEVRRLCAIDGGIRVYEQVKLPSEKLTQGNYANFRPAEGENALGSEYLFQMSRQWYTPERVANEFQARMSRVRISITRRSDSKLLGEMIVYQRAAGDVPGPWHPTSYSCPEIPGGEHALIRQTFK
jgi:hypothetical protein